MWHSYLIFKSGRGNFMKKRINKYQYGIDHISEIKKYKKVCKNKDRNCQGYLQWRDHILRLIETFDIEKLENYRRYCIFQEGIERHGMNVFLSIILSFVTVIISNNPNTERGWFLNWSIPVSSALVSTIFITVTYFDYNFSKSFYHDVAEIVKEKIESLPEKEQLKIKIHLENDLITSNE